RGTLALECPVRTQTHTRVSIANPLPEDVTLRASASNKQVGVAATTLLRANATTEVEVRYRPLVVASSEATLKLECAELGLYEWALRLAGTPTNPERSLAFNVPLGGRETQLFRFTHWLDEKADYKVTFKSSGTAVATGGAFTAAASVTAPAAAAGAGSEATLEVHFEPTAIGENIRDTLVVTSATGGEYQCPLVGRCIPPKPQGPVDVGKGSAALPFTNVFAADADYLLAVDNPAFVVKASERIASKKAASIAITYKPADASKPKTGKLTISCPAQTSSQWVYYLQA
ncbi:Hydrocephalus-inducing, partial [Tetrabaena socialis]